MTFIRSVALAAFGVLATTTTHAQEIAPGNITVIVPFAAGGPVDVTARLVVPYMSEKLGRQIIIENQGGAGGMTGSSRAKNAAPDGRTLLVGNTGTHAYNQWLYKRPQYDAVADFTPVGHIVENSKLLVVRKDLGVKTLKEFIAYATTNQAKMQYGSAGMGSGTHISCVIMNSVLKLNVAHVPYRGSGPSMQDLIGGRIDYMCEVISTALPQINGGQIVPIVVLSNDRSKVLPDLPTGPQAGVEGLDSDGWNSMFLPKGAHPAVVQRFADVLSETLDIPHVSKRFDELGLTVPPPARRGPAHLAKAVREEIAKSEKPIKSSGASVE